MEGQKECTTSCKVPVASSLVPTPQNKMDGGGGGGGVGAQAKFYADVAFSFAVCATQDDHCTLECGGHPECTDLSLTILKLNFLFISNGNCPSHQENCHFLDLPDCQVNFVGGTITFCNISITPGSSGGMVGNEVVPVTYFQ